MTETQREAQAGVAVGADGRAPGGVREFVAGVLEEGGVGGLSLAFVEDGRVAWAEGFGVRERARALPATAATVYEAGSLSKPVFAYCALLAWQRGLLDLDAPLVKYLPEPFVPHEPRLRLITARMALAHTTGFENWREAGEPLRVVATPGRHFTYSGEGYVYLQRVLERLTGDSLADYARRHVFEPFGMRESGFDWAEEFEATAARSYDEAGDLDRSFMWDYAHGLASPETEGGGQDVPEFSLPNAASGLYTSAADYARFICEIISPAGEGRLSEKGAAEMLKPQVSAFESIGWGLGWGLQPAARGSLFFHWGNQNSFQHFACGSRESRSGLVILTNGARGLKACRRIAPHLLGEELPVFAYLDL